MDKDTNTNAAGMDCYEYLVDHINDDKALIDSAVAKIIEADTSGQFCASATRFLAAVDAPGFAPQIDALLKAVIDKDRAKAYLPDLLPAVWGADYTSRADELRESDDNFRRIYKRVHPSGVI